MTKKEQLIKWFSKGKFFDVSFLEFDDFGDGERCRLFTANHYYSLVYSEKNNYLVGFMSNRLPREGEDWLRGNDIAGGSFSEETFNKIMFDIISSEMVKRSEETINREKETLKYKNQLAEVA